MLLVYCMGRSNGRQLLSLKQVIGALLSLFEFALVTRSVLESPWSLDMEDFKDSVFRESARGAGASVIVTRDRKGFFPLRDLRHDA